MDAIWSNPPPRPCGPIRVHPFKYAGKSSTDKLSDLKSSLRSKKATAQLVCSLDEVAWLLNIRGSDLTCTPVAFAYVLVVAEDDGGDGSGGGASGCTLFIDEQKLNDEVKQYLPSELRIRPYSEALDVFEDLVKVLDGVLLDKSQLSLAVGDAVPENKRVYAPSPITLKKAIKNESEINGIRNCHIRDGAALTAFLAWLEEAVNQSVSEKGGEPLTEYTICEKLESYRSAQSGYVEPSFPAITGFGPNGAIMHYRATPEVGIIHSLVLDTAQHELNAWSIIYLSFNCFCVALYLFSHFYPMIISNRTAIESLLFTFLHNPSSPPFVSPLLYNSYLYFVLLLFFLFYSQLLLWTHHLCSCLIRVDNMRMAQLILLALCIGGRQLIMR